jgi:hypothetical protein
MLAAKNALSKVYYQGGKTASDVRLSACLGNNAFSIQATPVADVVFKAQNLYDRLVTKKRGQKYNIASGLSC